MRLIDDAERRARLGRRHCLTPSERAGDVGQAAERVVCLHATDPATVFLSAWARCREMGIGDLEQAVYVDRSLVKHLAMRRTLFVFPRDLLGAAQAGASDRVADQERRRLIADVEKAGLHRNGGRWLAKASGAVMERLSDGREASMKELRDEIPSLEGSLTYGEGRSWGGQVSVGPRVLTTLSAAGRIVRATNDGGWTTSRPRWSLMSAWLGHDLEPPTAPEGVATLVRRWLQAFGPGTETDLKWWLGSTLTAVRQALVDVDAVEVQLEDGTGFVLPDDVEAAPPTEPWAALLPPLDPTTMGWKQRAWYLGPHKDQLFDRAGNAGSTAWWDGRIVGGWCRDEDGGVHVQLLEPVSPDGQRALGAEAERLTAWLDGAPLSPRFPSPLWKIGIADG